MKISDHLNEENLHLLKSKAPSERSEIPPILRKAGVLPYATMGSSSKAE